MGIRGRNIGLFDKVMFTKKRNCPSLHLNFSFEESMALPYYSSALLRMRIRGNALL